jgi:flagellar biosynthesis chaperone FliJ
MNRQKMLYQVLAIAQREQQERQFFFANAERQLLRSRETEKVLVDYQGEQLRLKRKQMSAVLGSQQLLVSRSFSEKVEFALAQQRAKVAVDESSLALARTRLISAMVHLRSIERLQRLRELRLRDRVLKREQQQTDEIAAIKAYSQKANEQAAQQVKNQTKKDCCNA